MDFSYTDEQQMLLDSARRYVREQYTFDARRRMLTSAPGHSPAAWRGFADLGLLSLNVPEAHGGVGGGAVETMLVSMALGEGLVLEPYLGSAVQATRAIARIAEPGRQAVWLPRLASGESVMVLVGEGTPGAPAPVSARRVEAGVELNGQVDVVYHAPLADLLLVAAASEPGGVADQLYALPPDAPLVINPCTTVDGQPAAEVVFDRLLVAGATRVGGDATAELAALADYAVIALCAEALGALDRTMALTVEYTRNRQQFGQPIARFQALQHRMVDMKSRIEQARSLVYLAAARYDGSDARQRASDASAAKVLIADAARFCGEQAVQLHGGMGVSDEVAISHYFKRLVAARLRLGSEYAHLTRYAQLSAAG